MLNILDVSRTYENQWIVLDKRQNVVDHGPDLEALWDKYADIVSHLTFYFAAALSR
jgi:hypothetical protein